MATATDALDPAKPALHAGLQRDPLGSQIASLLRREIYLGRLRPGTRLGQQELCEQFGTSRMPVRDALRELVYDGLLVRDGARQVVVAPLHRADLLDSFQIEGMLNGMAAARATANATQEDFQRLEEFHGGMLRCAGSGDYAEMARLNWQFHRYINRLAGSRKLLAALRVVSLDVPRDYLTQLPEWAQKSNREHEAIINAMKSHDSKGAEALMTRHLADSGTGLADYLASQGLEFG
jgi:DNA-binding GntR family transcriptional regulator